MIEYDDIKVQLEDLVTISDIALVDGKINSIGATLSVINGAMKQLINELEERESHAR